MYEFSGIACEEHANSKLMLFIEDRSDNIFETDSFRY